MPQRHFANLCCTPAFPLGSSQKYMNSMIYKVVTIKGFCILILPCLCFANEIDVHLAYPAQTKAQTNFPYVVGGHNQESWTLGYSGIADAGVMYQFTIPKGFDLGMGADYSLALSRIGISASSPIPQLLLHRIAAQSQVDYRLEPLSWMSIRPFLGNEVLLWDGSGSSFKGLSPSMESAIGLTIGMSVFLSVSKSISLGPEMCYACEKELMSNGKNPIAALSMIQMGISLQKRR
jgi:hypothetical protein